MRKIFWLLLSICLLLAGCTGDKDDGMIAGKFGEPVETAFLTFTVSGAHWGEPPEGQTGADGKQYLWVELQVRNTTSADQPLYYDEFDLYIGGEPRFPERVTSSRQLEENQLLAAGADVTGCLVYLVPTGASDLKLVYEEYYQGDSPGQQFKVALEKKNIASE